MNEEAQRILRNLRVVDEERAARAADPALAGRIDAVKRYQHARFGQTYADLMAQPRYAPAARFFLEELYGPGDFSRRDAQFARVVPALVRLFPHEIVGTVAALSELHALSEVIDTRMGRALAAGPLDDSAYGAAWRAASTPEEREHQIRLMLQVGGALDRHTRKPLLRQALRLMRGPAQAAGLADLQRFLESGFDTFRDLRGAEGFLGTIAQRERGLAARLFAGAAPTVDGPPGSAAGTVREPGTSGQSP